jgi:NADP-dependent 3-hydroxy acid dehydrogenase YdfG
MKIAITGHTAGIGQAFTKILADRGHEIVGLSKRHGDNIRNTAKIMEKIVPCDMLINNAQAGYAQTELLYAVWQAWRDQPGKHIWCIGTTMTQAPVDQAVPGQSDMAMSQYRNQKIALDDAIAQLRNKTHSPIITMIRPGAVATQLGQTANWPYCEVDAWANTVVSTMLLANEQGMRYNELTLSAAKNRVPL